MGVEIMSGAHSHSTSTDKRKKKDRFALRASRRKDWGACMHFKRHYRLPELRDFIRVMDYQVHSGYGLRCYLIYYYVNLFDPRSFIYKVKRC